MACRYSCQFQFIEYSCLIIRVFHSLIIHFSEEFARPSFFSKSKTEETNMDESEMAGFRRKGFKEFRSTGGQGPVGNWEYHTKGVASKLMMKVSIFYICTLSTQLKSLMRTIIFQMGYQPGKGLGKDLQGINAPIEAHLRKGRGAIGSVDILVVIKIVFIDLNKFIVLTSGFLFPGAYGPEKKQQKMKTENQNDEPEVSKKSDKTSLWRKEGSKSRKKIDYVYKSIDDVIEESKKPGKKKTEIRYFLN